MNHIDSLSNTISGAYPVHGAFTDQAIRGLPLGYHWDGKLRGFGVRVLPSGKRSFHVLIASGRRKHLGTYPTLTLANARSEATRLLAEKTLGRIRPTHTAFDDAKREFLEDCKSRLKARTVADYDRFLTLYFPYQRKSVADISAAEIVRQLKRLSNTPAEKRHAHAIGRTFFRWCLSQHLVDKNPMEQMQVPRPSPSRERVLNDAELAKVLKLAMSQPLGFYAIVALLILTGQRRIEIGALEWDWIDEANKQIVYPSTFTKNHREHCFPVGDRTLAVLASIARLKDNPYVFPATKNGKKERKATIINSWSKSKAAFDKKLKLAPWTLHDLRRTFRTNWAQLGVTREVAEKYINHVSGVHSGVNAIYDRYSYLPEMRIAVSRWEERLQDLVKE